jgi:hypothetical protein
MVISLPIRAKKDMDFTSFQVEQGGGKEKDREQYQGRKIHGKVGCISAEKKVAEIVGAVSDGHDIAEDEAHGVHGKVGPQASGEEDGGHDVEKGIADAFDGDSHQAPDEEGKGGHAEGEGKSQKQEREEGGFQCHAEKEGCCGKGNHEGEASQEGTGQGFGSQQEEGIVLHIAGMPVFFIHERRCNGKNQGNLQGMDGEHGKEEIVIHAGGAVKAAEAYGDFSRFQSGFFLGHAAGGAVSYRRFRIIGGNDGLDGIHDGSSGSGISHIHRYFYRRWLEMGDAAGEIRRDDEGALHFLGRKERFCLFLRGGRYGPEPLDFIEAAGQFPAVGAAVQTADGKGDMLYSAFRKEGAEKKGVYEREEQDESGHAPVEGKEAEEFPSDDGYHSCFR